MDTVPSLASGEQDCREDKNSESPLPGHFYVKPLSCSLDEATSALDSESEGMIQKALMQLVLGKTVLIIAHRFSSIKNASKILVFEQGRIIDEGSHEDLYDRCPLYRNLFDPAKVLVIPIIPFTARAIAIARLAASPTGASANEKWLIGVLENFRIHGNSNERKKISTIKDLIEVRSAKSSVFPHYSEENSPFILFFICRNQTVITKFSCLFDESPGESNELFHRDCERPLHC